MGSPPNMIQQRSVSRSEDPGNKIRAGAEPEPDPLHKSKHAIFITTIPFFIQEGDAEVFQTGQTQHGLG